MVRWWPPRCVIRFRLILLVALGLGHVPDSNLYRMRRCTVLSMSYALARPWAYRLRFSFWTSHRSPVSPYALFPCAVCGRATTTVVLTPIWPGRKFATSLRILGVAFCLWSLIASARSHHLALSWLWPSGTMLLIRKLGCCIHSTYTAWLISLRFNVYFLTPVCCFTRVSKMISTNTGYLMKWVCMWRVLNRILIGWLHSLCSVLYVTCFLFEVFILTCVVCDLVVWLLIRTFDHMVTILYTFTVCTYPTLLFPSE